MVISRRLVVIAMCFAMCFAMVPLSVIAALPVVYCQGSSGHIALEFFADNTQKHSNSVEAGAIEDDCIDSGLTDVLSAPRATGRLSPPFQVIDTIFSPFTADERTDGLFLRIVRRDPYLSTQRTVILRI